MKKSLLFFLLFSPVFLWSQSFNTQKLDSLLDRIDAAEKAMFSLAIHQDGKPIYTRAVGFADVESEEKANPKTMYRIGSISKTFTSTIILKLIEEGKLSLDTKLSTFYPELPNAEEITIKYLLNHHSGLFNFTNEENYTSWMQIAKSKEELLKIIKVNGTVFEPNEKGEYSNTNYVVLTWIAEDVSKKSFSSLLQQYIVTPLQLNRTRYQGKINPENNEAYSYKRGRSWIKDTETDMSIPLGAGAIVSSPSDLNKFFTALFKGKILTPSSLEKMKSLEDRYGLGLFQFPFYNKTSFGHTGGIDGFSSMSAYFEEENLAISITANGSTISMNDILLGALKIYFNKDYMLPTYKKPIEVDLSTLKKYVGIYGSDNFPLDIKIFVEDEVLKAQATGQASFPLEAIDENSFIYDPVAVKMVFIPEENKMIFTQRGQSIELNRK